LLNIPPFRDLHIHFLQGGKPVSLDRALAQAAGYVRRGIFFIREMGTAGGLGLAVKRQLNREVAEPVRLEACGQALFQKGTYGGFLGWGVSGKEEIKRAVKGLSEAGADFLKIMHSGIVSLKKGLPITAGGFSREELHILAEESRRYGLPLHVHVNGDQAVREAAALPAASIEHGFFVTPETLHLLREKDVVWTPTIHALAHLERGLSADQRRERDRIVDRHLGAVAYAVSIGVRVRVGTDSGAGCLLPGVSFFEELRLLKKAGLSPTQIVDAACLGPDENREGDYLLVREDFIDRGSIEEIYYAGRPLAARKI
jgi:imidazolonepropionase-like amidohydrolase